jgi:hypothetical protein
MNKSLPADVNAIFIASTSIKRAIVNAMRQVVNSIDSVRDQILD